MKQFYMDKEHTIKTRVNHLIECQCLFTVNRLHNLYSL